MKRFFLFFLLCVGVSFGSYKSQIIRIRSAQDFMEGKGENVAFLQDGGLTFAPSIRKVLDSPEAFLWTLASGEKGLKYVGTGQRGLLLIYDAKWKLVRQVVLPAVNITTLLPFSRGVLAAGFPSGRVFRVDSKGEVHQIANLETNYVWKLFENKGKVYALTGEPACFFQLLPKKKKIFCGEAGHFLSGLPVGEKFLIASGNPAALLEVDAEGKAIARVAFDGEDAYSVVGDERRLFVAVNGQQALSSKKQKKSDLPEKRKVLDGKYQAPSFSKTIFPSRKKKSERSAKVYRMEAGKLPRVVLDVGDPVITSLFLSGDTLYVGTGNEGTLYRYHLKSGEAEAIVMPSRQILSLSQIEQNLWIVAGNPAALYLLNPLKSVDSLRYVSKIVDLRNSAKLGKIGYRGTMPDASLSLRAGNTPNPDTTWTDWFLSEQGSKIPFRYLQFRVEAGREKGNDSITELFAFAHLINRPPQILSLDLRKQKAPSVGKSSGSSLLPATMTNRKRLVIKAIDPDNDRLIFDIYLKKETGETVRLQTALSTSFYDIDFKKLPEGYYRLKVVARDILSNADAEALSDVLLTHPFYIDRTPPKVQYRQEKGFLLFTVQEELSYVASARIAYGGWVHRLLPKDGIFDGREELFKVPLKKLSFPLFFRTQDKSGNTATLWVEKQTKKR